ncbi:MAG: hypothetical protein R2828_11020 [Saprospiraceae bacterium]
MANAWKTGRAGLALNGIIEISGLKNGMAPKGYLNDLKRKEKGASDLIKGLL